MTSNESGPGLDDTTGEKLDMASPTGEPPPCIADGTCDALDILLVVDNSSSMSQEQLNVARNLPLLIDELMGLTDLDGEPLDPNVNLMVTTTDVGHPLCTPLQKPGYEPRMGAPVDQGCNERIERFTGLDPMDPLVIEEACTEGCPVDVVPDEHFIHFGPDGTNVPNDDVHGALSCIGPQGFDGCSYQAPLEAMLLALDETACWNDPNQPECDATEWAEATQGFLREDATLVIMVVTDGLDCSVAPDGLTFFTDDPTYWNIDPELGMARASPAICFNAGVSCNDVDGDGLYEGCAATDGEVLHPVERYVSALRELTEQQGKDVVMLGILGVPEVTEHNPLPPYQPVAGGVFNLLYRGWIDFPYPSGDILPDDWAAGHGAAHQIFEHGNLAPGCTGQDGTGAFTGQAQPPVRMREVCESLDYYDEELDAQVVRCCIESICDTDFSPAIRCITGLLSDDLADLG